MKLRFKIGTHSAIVHEVEVVPAVGDKIQLPYPTGGVHSALITEIDFQQTLASSLFIGEWM